ncbi:hypothetical protein [Zobellia sp. B3R18]|uniref:hypothetical protein n=1 Tax=Zobellia sp. B3R18 TaxID=2841568 RepID=UPI001C06D5F2|nr:hypothetical protein [Zobellia sp. B3R18]MBU2973202.1 hypothetical protein [Zobellia sp. B3R18]
MIQDFTADYEKVLLKDSLFSKYSLENADEMDLLNLLYFIGGNDTYSKLKIIDSFCTKCKKNTTFNSEECDEQELKDMLTLAGMHSGNLKSKNENTLVNKLEKKSLFIRKFTCPRQPNDPSHSQYFIFRVINKNLIKVGQHPTLADLTTESISKYRKLNEDIYSELNRAIGLAAHGVGIGAFVYLRRIIEKHILTPKINELISEEKIAKEELFKKDFKEKINLAKDKLPSFLVENTKIYSILSKGIHALDEEECKEHFPILRTSIEIILDEQIEKNQREKKNKLIAASLNKLT